MPIPIKFHCLNTGKVFIPSERITVSVDEVASVGSLIRRSESTIFSGKFSAKLDVRTGSRIAELRVISPCGSDGFPLLDASFSWLNECGQRDAFMLCERKYLDTADAILSQKWGKITDRYSKLSSPIQFDSTPYVCFHLATKDTNLEEEVIRYLRIVAIRLIADFNSNEHP